MVRVPYPEWSLDLPTSVPDAAGEDRPREVQRTRVD
jgi:hypothetical protein